MKNYISIHSLTVLESLGIKIEELCGKKYNRELFIFRQKMKKMEAERIEK